MIAYYPYIFVSLLLIHPRSTDQLKFAYGNVIVEDLLQEEPGGEFRYVLSIPTVYSTSIFMCNFGCLLRLFTSFRTKARVHRCRMQYTHSKAETRHMRRVDDMGGRLRALHDRDGRCQESEQ